MSQNMVMTFRVTELQTLLGLANQSKCGRKTELLQRSLMLVERGLSVAIQAKVREMYRKYMPASRVAVPLVHGANSYTAGGGRGPAAQMLNKCGAAAGTSSAMAAAAAAQGNKGGVMFS